ncbi:MAG: hypothetical protein WC423_21560 [Vulcanimicrobiota bacterium]
MKCWNCLAENPKKSHRCANCDQPLKPNAAQSVTSKRSLDYLLHEIEEWSFLPPTEKVKVQSVYSARLARLSDAGSTTAWADWPLSDWSSEIEKPETVLDEEVVTNAEDLLEAVPELVVAETAEEPPEDLLEAPEPAPPLHLTPDLPAASEKSLVASLVGEADIRWFHSLGALLVVAAVVGWLRASWDSYGRTLAGLLIAASPLLLHLIAHKLKRSVPLSSRLLAILANLLTPPALLALDVFGALPASVSSSHYWTFSLLVSAGLLSWQAEKTREKVPLYVGALCAVTAGWSQGALLTALCSLAVGFLFAWDTGSDEPEWAKLRKSVSFYAGSFGALATLALFDTAANPYLPVTALSVALVFLHLPTLSGQTESSSSSRVFMQTALTLVGSILMRAVLGVPAGGVALYLIFASALFLAAKPDSRIAAGAARVASGIGSLALLIGFLSDLPSVLSSQQSLHQAGLRFLFTAAGTVFFWTSSRKNQQDQSLFLLGLFTLLGGWTHLLLYAITRQPIESPDQLAPLFAGLPIFAALLLLVGKWMHETERNTTANFLAPVLTGGLALSAGGRLLNPAAAVTWEAILLLYAAVAVAWERGWLVSSPVSLQLRQGLPRLTLLATAILLSSVPRLPLESAFLAAATTLVVASFLVRGEYRKASFELAWLTLWSGLPFSDHSLLFAGALLSFTLTLSDRERQAVALLTATAYSLVVMVMVAGDFPYLLLFLPAILFAGIQYLSSRGLAEKAVGQKHRVGFDILLAAAILVGGRPEGGSNESLTYCVLLAGLACGFAWAWEKAQARVETVLSPHSGQALFGILLLWSLEQSTLETGILLMLAGLGAHFFLSSGHRAEICNALVISGAAQFASDTHLLLDPVVVGLGIFLSESLTLFRKHPSPQYSNLALLVVASVQGRASFVEGWTVELLLVASLILALRCVQQDFYPTALIAGTLFLWKVDPFLVEGLDLKYRLIPMACVFVGCAVWKWNRDFTWTRPLLHSGLALLVAPACLQFILGFQLIDNFVWMLAFGCSYLILSFVLPETYRRSFRQAGGYTLSAWAAVSLTRVALQLPWQAATLMIGLALVTVGIVVERRNRGREDRTEL